MCPPPVSTTNDYRLRNFPIARSIMYWPICSHQVCRTSFRCSTSWMQQRRQEAVGVLLRSDSLGYSAANFLVHKFWHMNTQKLNCLTHHLVEKSTYYQTTSECLVVHPDSERRHSNKNCRLWLQAEQTPVTFFLCLKLWQKPCSVKNVCGLSKGVTLDGHVGINSIVLRTCWCFHAFIILSNLHLFSTQIARFNALSSLNGHVFKFTSTTSATTSHRILITGTAEYFKWTFIFTGSIARSAKHCAQRKPAGI